MTELGDIGVVGAGFMGSGIAEAAARAGARVRVFEPQEPALDRSRTRLATPGGRALARGKMDDVAGQALIERISFHTELEDLAASEVVIEAVFEDPEVKGP